MITQHFKYCYRPKTNKDKKKDLVHIKAIIQEIIIIIIIIMMLFIFLIYTFCKTEGINFAQFLILMFFFFKSCPISIDIIGLRVPTWNLRDFPLLHFIPFFQPVLRPSVSL